MIILSNIHFSYGEKEIFKDLSLSIAKTGIHCVVGASGAGKTSLLRLVAGLLVPDSGKMEALPQKPAFLFQENRLLPQFTALENVAAVLPKESGDAAKAYLQAVGLLDEIHSKPRELSGGMCRRVALARTLAYGGDFLLLDEPFTGLDPKRKQEMADLICAQNIPALVVTHSDEEIKLLQSETIISIGAGSGSLEL